MTKLKAARQRVKKIYFTPAEVAQVIGRTTQTARIWLRREGALLKRGGRYYTTAERLLAAFPEAFQELAR